jgi:hypothetical protein
MSKQWVSNYRAFGFGRRENRAKSRASVLLIPLMAATTILGIAAAAPAATVNWVGPANTPAPFELGSNWSGGAVPGAEDDAFINDQGIATLSTSAGR